MIKYKRLTKGRSITIPKDIAAAAGITGGMAVDLINSDDNIVIRPHIPACVFCGNEVPKDGYHLNGRTVCTECVNLMRKDYDEYYGKDN